VSEVAERFGVSVQAVRDWADQGRLPHFRTPGGQRRFRPEDVAEFLKTQEPAPKAATA
jgi:excisionase family DNA binding protein